MFCLFDAFVAVCVLTVLVLIVAFVRFFDENVNIFENDGLFNFFCALFIVFIFEFCTSFFSYETWNYKPSKPHHNKVLSIEGKLADFDYNEQEWKGEGKGLKLYFKGKDPIRFLIGKIGKAKVYQLEKGENYYLTYHLENGKPELLSLYPKE